MNDAIDIAALQSLGAIGQPLRRKEDQRLLTGNGRFSDDFSLPGQAYAAIVRSPHPARPDRADRHGAGGGDAGGAGRFYRSGLRRRRAGADPAQPGAVDPVRHEIDRARRRPGLHRPANLAAHRQGAPCRRGGGDRRGRNRGAGAGRCRGGRGRIRRAALGRADARCVDARCAGGLGGCAGQRARRYLVRRRRGDRARLCGRRSHRRDGVSHRSRDRRSDRAARRPWPLGRRNRTLYAVGRQRWRGSAESGNRRRARGRARAGAGAVLRCRRQFRHPKPPLCRIGAGAMGVAPARPSGQIHLDPIGSVPQRFSGSRPADPRGAGIARRRPFSRAARRQCQQCRRPLRLAVAAEQGLGPGHRLLRHPGGAAQVARGLHQHDADQRLSQLGPARGHLRDRAGGRRGGAPARHRPRRVAPDKSDRAGGDAVRQCRRRPLRQRHLRGQHGSGDADRRLGRLCGAPGDGGGARQIARPGPCELCRNPRSARHASAARSR